MLMLCLFLQLYLSVLGDLDCKMLLCEVGSPDLLSGDMDQGRWTEHSPLFSRLLLLLLIILLLLFPLNIFILYLLPLHTFSSQSAATLPQSILIGVPWFNRFREYIPSLQNIPLTNFHELHCDVCLWLSHFHKISSGKRVGICLWTIYR